ncbi:MAG: hypothetical protein KDH09_17655 [Chrysiogenetes bacterium]|nr:hypothetical protein [Chrysiogenetes bacterium]
MSVRRTLLIGISAAIVVAGGLVWRHVSAAPSWQWLATQLPGDLRLEGAQGSQKLVWEGLWPDQTLRFSSPRIDPLWLPALSGKRGSEYHGDDAVSARPGSIKLRRQFFEPSAQRLPLIDLQAELGGKLTGALPLLRQIDVIGEWSLDAYGRATDNASMEWDGELALGNATFSFGPEDRERALGTLLLERVEAEYEVRGIDLTLTALRGTGPGIEVQGTGSVRVVSPPEKSQLDLSFTIDRKEGSPALRVSGWDAAITDAETLTVDIKGTVGNPVFMVNGFVLVEQLFRPFEPLASSEPQSMTQALASTAAESLKFEPEESQELPEYAELSESDIAKLKALVELENPRTSRSGSEKSIKNTAWGQRRRQMKRDFKRQLKKLKRQISEEGLEEREVLGRKPTRTYMDYIDRTLMEEFGAPPGEAEIDEADQRAAEEKAAREAARAAAQEEAR